MNGAPELRPFRVYPPAPNTDKSVVVLAMDAHHARKVFREQTGRVAGMRQPTLERGK